MVSGPSCIIQYPLATDDNSTCRMIIALQSRLFPHGLLLRLNVVVPLLLRRKLRYPLPLNILVSYRPDCAHVSKSIFDIANSCERTRLVRLGVLLQLGDEMVELGLRLLAVLQTPLLQLGIVSLEELLLGRGHPDGEGRSADADGRSSTNISSVTRFFSITSIGALHIPQHHLPPQLPIGSLLRHCDRFS